MDTTPSRVLPYFEEIAKIPHCSGDRDRIATYLMEFAHKHKFEAIRDEIDNVIIYKPASEGKEDLPYVALQGHTDMVCEKSSSSDHDFTCDAIELIREGDTLRANGTTLGGDNGIAVAMMLAILEDDTLTHPPLEMVFTSDEEIGLIGAHELDTALFRSERLINIDSEEEGVLLTGCAGGETFELSVPVDKEDAKGHIAMKIAISGLLGGHSGMEIHRKRNNAIKVLTEVLNRLKDTAAISLVSISGGTKHNAIPRDAEAVIAVHASEKDNVKTQLEEIAKELQEVYEGQEFEDIPKIETSFIAGSSHDIFTQESFERTLACLTLLPTGVYSMSKQIDGMVQTSDNLAIVETEEHSVKVIASLRSSDLTDWAALKEKILAVTDITKSQLEITGGYPVWEVKEHSPLRDTFSAVHETLYGKPMEVSAIHAGLECALFADRSDTMDLVSLGPDMYEVHTPQEHLSLSSVERVYQLITTVLSELS